ncbi:MAG: HAMP domain-containing protein [Desulfatibacillaceae bacterium]
MIGPMDKNARTFGTALSARMPGANSLKARLALRFAAILATLCALYFAFALGISAVPAGAAGRFQAMMLAAGIVGFAAAGLATWLFLNRLLTPMDEVRRVARCMAEGRLSDTADVRGDGEIGEISGLLNDVSVNVQEVLLTVWNQAGKTCDTLNGLDDNDGLSPEVRAVLDDVCTGMIELRELVMAWELYDVRVREQRAYMAGDTKRAHE